MLPIFELVVGHQEGTAVDLADPDIVVVEQEFTTLEAHGGRAVAAAAALMKHEFAVLVPQGVNDFFCFFGH